MPTTSLDLLDAVHQAILAADTAAGTNVFRPGDWPTQVGQYPIIKLRLVSQSRQSLGRGAVEFITIATIRAMIEVSAPARVDDLGAQDAETQLWNLAREVDVAVIGSDPLARLVQQVASVQSQLAFTSEAATHLAGLQMDIALEFYEGPWSFAPIDAQDFTEVDATVSAPDAALIIPTT